MANTDLEKTLLYYGTDDGLTLGAHLALNLQFVTKLEKDFTADNLVEIINNGLPLQYTPNWLVSIIQTGVSELGWCAVGVFKLLFELGLVLEQHAQICGGSNAFSPI